LCLNQLERTQRSKNEIIFRVSALDRYAYATYTRCVYLYVYTTMPDGFDPHVQLERIHTLREVMIDCRRAAPKIIEMYRTKLDLLCNNIDEVPTGELLLLGETILNRAYGKPRQQITVNTEADNRERQVRVYIPDNGRDRNGPTTIDA